MGEKIMTMAVEDISVVDVYDLASDIGKECEKIIDVFGADAVTSLMPKVINALELLEALANQNENENSAMQKLTDRIAYLESEKQEKAVFRERFQKVRNISCCKIMKIPSVCVCVGRIDPIWWPSNNEIHANLVFLTINFFHIFSL